ncbi:MAG: T9SS C-terminal target domain-containing protein [Bacteroidetes bacterium]|nr:MAG: T9SS C-terminal target domain-containing protein [Bacteroidota bacterium]
MARLLFTSSIIIFLSVQIIFSQSECYHICEKLTEEQRNTVWEQRKSLRFKDDSLQRLFGANRRSARTAVGTVYELSQALYLLPIKIWLHQNSAGTRGPTILKMQSEIDNLNRYYNNSGVNIQFYVTSDSPEIIKDDKYVDTKESDANYVIDHWYNEDIINVHMVDKYNGGGAGVYVSPFPLFQDEGLIISTDETANETIFSHEVGHHLGLEHTHEGGDEPISRTRKNTWGNIKCKTTGDGFCDTPADPNLNEKNSPSCVFTDQTAKDAWGDFYANPPAGSQSPDYSNIMSYANPRLCRNKFSSEQGQFMRTEADDMAYDGDFGNRSLFVFDKYEPDNQREIARDIVFGKTQHHSFHWVAKEEEEKSFSDVDWVTFTILEQTSIRVSTSAAYLENPDTEIKLHRLEANGSLTLIGQDNDSNGDKYSNLTANNLIPATYYIEIKPKNTGSTSGVYDYLLNITNCTPEFASIIGDYNNIEMKRAAKNTFTIGGNGNSFKLGPNGKLTVKAGQSIIITGDVDITGDFDASIDPNLTCDNSTSDIVRGARIETRNDFYYSDNTENPQENNDAIAKIFPNPLTNQDDLSLEIYSPIDCYFQLNIKNMLGNEIISNLKNNTIKAGYDRFKIETTDLANGMYIITINVGTKKFFHKLIISK